MSRRSYVILLTLVAWIMGCSSEPDPRENDRDTVEVKRAHSVPAGFEKVQTKCNFDFYAPPGIVEVPVLGIDSCVLRFELDDCDLVGGSGAFSGRLSSEKEEQDYADQRVTIDGRSATLARFLRRDGLYGTAVHIPISDKGGWYTSIDLSISCATAERRDEMRDVLLSIDPSENW